MSNLENLINLENREGKAVVSSREVARNFEKRHDHILRDIEGLKGDIPNFGEMFVEGEEPDSYDRLQRVYFITKNGFALLVMGFTERKLWNGS